MLKETIVSLWICGCYKSLDVSKNPDRRQCPTESMRNANPHAQNQSFLCATLCVTTRKMINDWNDYHAKDVLKNIRSPIAFSQVTTAGQGRPVLPMAGSDGPSPAHRYLSASILSFAFWRNTLWTSDHLPRFLKPLRAGQGRPVLPVAGSDGPSRHIKSLWHLYRQLPHKGTPCEHPIACWVSASRNGLASAPRDWKDYG